jgi:hypothetical protein
MARSGPPKVAMCVVRIESRGEAGVLITVTTASNINVTAPGRSQSVAGPEEALALVAGFLREYQEKNSPITDCTS